VCVAALRLINHSPAGRFTAAGESILPAVSDRFSPGCEHTQTRGLHRPTPQDAVFLVVRPVTFLRISHSVPVVPYVPVASRRIRTSLRDRKSLRSLPGRHVCNASTHDSSRPVCNFSAMDDDGESHGGDELHAFCGRYLNAITEPPGGLAVARYAHRATRGE